MADNCKVLITCEHGGNEIPAQFEELFAPHATILETHRGYDPGALPMAKKLAQHCADSFFYSTNSRLLIDLNRSLHHRNSLSFITSTLEAAEKELIIQNFFIPYREQITETVRAWIQKKYQVIHVAVHSYTPVLNNHLRNNDIGLLYDSRRLCERNFCQEWKPKILALDPSLVVRFNYPYLGKADGLGSYLRKHFSAEFYLSLELEVNQKFYLHEQDAYQKITQTIIESFTKAKNDFSWR